jgi:hypothetical protein
MSRQQPGQPKPLPSALTEFAALHTICGRDVIQGIVVGASALVAALALVWLLLPVIHPTPASLTRPSATLQVFSGKDFVAERPAESRMAADTPGVSHMLDEEAVFSIKASVPLDHYRYVRLDLAGGQAGLRYFLFWRTVETPDKQYFVQLEGAGNGPSWHRFPDPDLWQGTTTDVAVGAFGTSDEPITLHSVRFEHGSRASLVKSAWTAWHAINSWSGSSINRHFGAPKSEAQFPAALLGLWAAIAFSLVALWALKHRGRPRALISAGLLALFIPWWLLDRLWQAQLDRQLLVTRDVFAHRAQAEKHEADADAALYDYARHIKIRLAAQDSRVFLLHNSEGHNFNRLKLQFHLLPANVYNYGDQLMSHGELRRGDYVLTLGAVPDIQYSRQTQVLSDGHHSYRGQLVDIHALGNLYLISGYAGPGGTP